ncbi:type II CAAX prenyl endopeptidase Rce1 family protein [Gemmata obscuriglobus]|uniref:CPBP family glutamic-type intramembrane protease n=1 Tax=Gemmata obscuriglobus TaxID=114 RepID=UPI0002DCF03B|nr:CPBP family glutamic-type intramembrane protease [Gemmata obscuriglobus]
MLVAPLIVLGLLLLWSWWRWSDRPEDPLTALFGMAFESVLFAVVLWQFSRNFGPIIDGLGIKLQLTFQTAPAAQILTFIGAGIYEEVLFRLGLFGGLVLLLRVVGLPGVAALPLAAFAAALAFAAAHHVGPYGEPMRADYFVFRTIAGLFFTSLFVFRGFGIAVGAHAGYDILVGVVVS